jgi:hypothetical protein
MAGKATCTRKSRPDLGENGVITKKKLIIISSNNLNDVEERTMDHGKKHRYAPILAIFALFAVSAFSGELDSLHMQLFGSGSTQFGQIVEGQYTFARTNDNKLDHYWIERATIQMGLNVKQSNGLDIILASEGQVYFPYAGGGDGSGFGYELLEQRYKWYPTQVEATFTKGDPSAAALNMELGFFPYKYNPDGRNFGDYFYRLSTYPQYMPTSFDMPFQRILGLRLNGTFFSSLKADLLLTSEVYLWPLKDFSLAGILDYNFLKFFDMGAGIMWHRLISVDNSLTTPPTSYQNGYDFTFAGTKVMFRGVLDFKTLMPFNFWGKNDLRLYGEMCLDGLKNYPITDTSDEYYPGYNDLLKRTPIMFGFNVPTCKVLDVLSLEAEWWDSYPFANSYWGVYPVGYKQNPFPDKYVSTSPGHKAYPYAGPWHWSVYAKKNVLNNINLIFQVARDHTILETTLTGTSNADPQEAMDGLGNWGWMAKIEYCF